MACLLPEPLKIGLAQSLPIQRWQHHSSGFCQSGQRRLLQWWRAFKVSTEVTQKTRVAQSRKTGIYANKLLHTRTNQKFQLKRRTNITLTAGLAASALLKAFGRKTLHFPLRAGARLKR
jgi:hypothetical protein